MDVAAVQPDVKASLTLDIYRECRELLCHAREGSNQNCVFYTLSDNEDPNLLKKMLLYVAGREGIRVSIRKVREAKRLAFIFA